ncbi:DNA-binding domain of Mlu1-box binding protein MBP1 [Xylona heveae TC161]|uniref:DNA-binding domain of Mlu1-box binding protein MBP1 n=1 Tax=Xylona heveae (strain CBS 132557 / TC161) TaxID=1328760 RepID=A0A165H9Z3_XYLHT|nr:DNA-binding domain of Mlu1-box binding protein MBP1 [Xylona heveae TC161]KZF23193.1 DNA-binding domain of Mlu1-box binding protein MBP1 [Xylona heveae TC161]
MAPKRSLPKQFNPLLAEEHSPPHEILVERRRLGQTTLAVKPGQVGTSSATKPENLGIFDYMHLRCPLPKDLEGSEIFTASAKQPYPESYFLMRRLNDGYVSATGMFKAAFPWARRSEDEAERKYIKSLSTTSKDETAGNVWISPEQALKLADEYRVRPWVMALIDPAAVDKAPVDFRPSSSSPSVPKISPPEGNTALPPPTPSRRGRQRSSSPGKTAARKIATPRKPRAVKNTDASSASMTSTSPKSTSEKSTPMKSNAAEEEKVRVEIDEAIDEADEVETTTTNVKIEMPVSAPELPLPESPEEMIAKAKEMVEEARKLDGESSPKGKAIKRKADEIEEGSEDEDIKLQRIKKARVIQGQLKREKVRTRALLGLSATLAIGAIIPYFF